MPGGALEEDWGPRGCPRRVLRCLVVPRRPLEELWGALEEYWGPWGCHRGVLGSVGVARGALKGD